jgi:hypothetical protein
LSGVQPLKTFCQSPVVHAPKALESQIDRSTFRYRYHLAFTPFSETVYRSPQLLEAKIHDDRRVINEASRPPATKDVLRVCLTTEQSRGHLGVMVQDRTPFVKTDARRR